MKKIVIFLSLITALLCLNISRSEADVVSLASYQVTMTAMDQPVTPMKDGIYYDYGLLGYGGGALQVSFNKNISLGGATSLSAWGQTINWPGLSGAVGIEDYYFRLISQKPLPSNILVRPVRLNITYAASVYASSYNPQTVVEAEMEIRPPGGVAPIQLFHLLNTVAGTTTAQDVNKAISVKLGETWGIHLMGGGFVQMPLTTKLNLYFNANIDPTVVIDPEFELFDTNGSPYLAKDLFAVEFSPNLAVPVPGALWLFGSGLLGLVGWRRFRKS